MFVSAIFTHRAEVRCSSLRTIMWLMMTTMMILCLRVNPFCTAGPCNSTLNILGLEALKNATTIPTAFGWRCLSPEFNWSLSDLPSLLCSTSGVPGVTCNAVTGNITEIDLSNCEIGGVLPASVSFTSLRELRRLTITKGVTSGSLPFGWVFANLERLVLSNLAGLSAGLPGSWPSGLSRLEMLDLSNNAGLQIPGCGKGVRIRFQDL